MQPLAQDKKTTEIPARRRNKSLLVLGGTSDIGRATAQCFARKGWDVLYCGRDLQAMQANAADTELRCNGISATAGYIDILDPESFQQFLDSLPCLPDLVLSAVGLLGDQAEAERSISHASLIMRSNFEGPSLLLALIADRFEKRGSGTIVGISSVAGDRGRASNYTYGAAKAGFTAFLSGLRNRLAKKGVQVVTVKPGFVRSRMTGGMQLPAALMAEPDEVGKAIFKAVSKGQNIIYVRPIWRPIMTIICLIPESIFKRMNV